MKDLSHPLQDPKPATTIARKKNLSPIMSLARTNHLSSQPTKTLTKRKNIFPQTIPIQRTDTMTEDVHHTDTKATTTDNPHSQDLLPHTNTARDPHHIQETKITEEETTTTTTNTTQEITTKPQHTKLIQDQTQDIPQDPSLMTTTEVTTNMSLTPKRSPFQMRTNQFTSLWLKNIT